MTQAYPSEGVPYGSPPAQRGSGMATAALVLGILAIVTSITVIGGFVLGLLAVVFGAIGLGRAKRGEADGRGRALAGIITGGLGLLLAVVLIVVGVTVFNSKAGKTYQSCVNNAQGNQAQMQLCARQFGQQLGG